MNGLMLFFLVVLVFYAGVLISFRSTVRDHPYIAFGTAGFMLCSFFLPEEPVGVAMFASAIWAAYDVRKLEIYKYRVGGVTNIVTAFFGCWLLWPIFFTWVLVNRHMILDGKAKLKGNYRKAGKPAALQGRSDTVESPPKTASAATSETAEQTLGSNVKYVDVTVEEVESEEEGDNTELSSAMPKSKSHTDTASALKTFMAPPKWLTPKIRLIACCIAAVLILGIAIPQIVDKFQSSQQSQRSAYQRDYYDDSAGYGQAYSGGQTSADATYRFWNNADAITRDWWRLSTSFSQQNNDPDVNFIATLVFLEGAIEALGNLSTQGVDSRAIQTIQNVQQCMYNFYSLGCDAVECRNRYGPRLPPAESNRLGMATVGLVIQFGLIHSEYTQTAQTLSTAYGRRFPGS